MRNHLRAAVIAGMFAGVVVGIIEAASAARATGKLAGPTLWPLWAITVGLYATMGWAAFGVLGLVVSGVRVPLRRTRSASHPASYYIAAAVAVPAALILGRPYDPADVFFTAMRAVAACTISGAVVWLVIRLARGRLVFHPRGAGACTSPARIALFGWPIPFLALVAWLGLGVAFPTAPAGAPNVLLITIDAMRADRLGCCGNRLGLTPNLDRLARDGVVFEKAFASAPWTEVSVGSMFTSLYPSELGLLPRARGEGETHYEGGVFTPQPTLAEVLRGAGYMTAAELANAQIRRDRGFARGFIRFRNADDYYGWRALALPRLGKYETWFVHTSIGARAAARLQREPRYYAAPEVGKQDAERLVRDAEAWLDSRPGAPFFLWLHLMDTHVPYNGREQSAATRAQFPTPPLDATPQFYKDLILKRIGISDAGKRYLEALYNDGARHADRWLGDLFARLHKAGLYDRTLIVVSADHGEEFWDHGGYEHGHSMYDEVLRVPLLIKFPRQQYAGERVRGQVRLLDLLPTVLDVAGLPTPHRVRGQSLVALLREHAMGRDTDQLFAEDTLYGKELKALRTSRFKAIFHPASREMEVYDLRADPGERHDLARDPRVAARLRERLSSLARESERRAAWWTRRGLKAPALDQESIERLRSIGYMTR